MSIIVQVCSAFGLTLSQKEIPLPQVPADKMMIKAMNIKEMKINNAGQRYNQTDSCVYFGGSNSETSYAVVEIARMRIIRSRPRKRPDYILSYYHTLQRTEGERIETNNRTGHLR